MAMKSRMKGGPRNTITSLQVKVQTNWLTPHGMGGIDSTGKLGAGGEFAKQATQWLTPNAPNGGRSVPAELVASKGTTEDGERRTVGLESQTKHWDAPLGSAWPTPRQTDGSKGGPNQAGSKGDLMLPSAAAQWPTPNTFDAVNAGTPEQYIARKKRTQETVGTVTDLSLRVQAWPTPASRDHKGTDLPSRRGGASLSHAAQTGEFSHSSPQAQPTPDGRESSDAPPGSPLRLNPAFGCWLMGWPCWWTNPGLTNSDKLATEFAHYRRQLHSSLSQLVRDGGQ